MTDPKILTEQDLTDAVGGKTQIGALSHVPGARNARQRGPKVNAVQGGPGEVGYEVDHDLEGNDW